MENEYLYWPSVNNLTSFWENPPFVSQFFLLNHALKDVTAASFIMS